MSLTAEEFRSTPLLRDELATLMQNDTLLTALSVVKAKGELMVIPAGLSGRDLAMILASRNTRAVVVDELLEMTRPPNDPPPEHQSEDFGTGHPIEEFDNPEPQQV